MTFLLICILVLLVLLARAMEGWSQAVSLSRRLLARHEQDVRDYNALVRDYNARHVDVIEGEEWKHGRN